MTITADFDFRNEPFEFVDEEMVRYIKTQQGKSNTEETNYKYAYGLEMFSQWLKQRNKSSVEVDFVDIKNYLSYLVNDKNYADKTANLRFIPVRGYYTHLEMLEEIPENPAEKVDTTEYYKASRTRTEERTGKRRVYLSKDEIKDLVDNVPDPRLRNRLVILFMYYTGLRRSEVCRVRLDDLDREHRTVQVEVKGGNKHTAVWHKKLDGLMTQWLDYGYRSSYPTAEDSPYLFITRASEQLSSKRLGNIVDKTATNAGLQDVMYEDARGRNFKRISCHTIRHSFAMAFLQDGGSMEALSNRLAHSSVLTTEIYGEVRDDRGIEEYNQVMEAIETDKRIEQDQCLLCGQEGNLQNHHISYSPEKIISVCQSCQNDIHSEDEYKHLQPEKSRKWAIEQDII